MSEVYLEVYDLSRGMAAAMSQSILGMRIDGIWHTGVVVFQKEYYFGGGIQCSSIGHFASSSNMQATRSVRIGVTTKTQEELQEYLRSVNHLFTERTYDLINNNCNNFSDCVCKFLVGTGIPSYIIELPRTIFSSPGGAMLRPLVENMQNSIRQQREGSLDPFGPISSGIIPNNPSFESSLSDALRAGVTEIVSTAVERKHIRAELEERPITSSDSTLLPSIATKLMKTVDEKGSLILSDEEGKILQTVIAAIQSKNIDKEAVTMEAYAVLERLLTTSPSSHMPCLFLLRLLALHDHKSAFESIGAYGYLIKSLSENSFSSVSSHVMALCTLANLLSHEAGQSFIFTGRSSVNNSSQPFTCFAGDVLDIGLRCLANDRPEIRQISAVLVYNFVLACTPHDKLQGLWASNDTSIELHQTAVQVLCGVLETIFHQPGDQGDVRRRKLAIVCRILRSYGAPAVYLLRELGYVEQLEMLISCSESTQMNPLDKQETTIVEEMLSIAILHA
mmetsp:Transcript_11689/g.16060  ORF Transcript_11689/g.16060 Transcript_11689/m.16060 type:complete len:506 (-) Transcript_11689:119-1636(-)|eukprot:CAMPEP_0201093976 /NCGR_PEP_ID=MMETSP0812-20130820/2399_1 /ASSEMBLY_ACC=CAM_ASM_000668 /TAXON_ID=98059 /ORGANISM="Dinobryon sp., Strain UTEXLB2267" /LENGTH=505 /DNA_ID=CAMNT_0047346391 /DNA_START=41 /DNA_END=1558 /DNA_ORIENTATION=+